MTFDELIERGWADHDRDAKGVAQRLRDNLALVDDAARAARFIALANHVLGQEGHDWPAAFQLGGAAMNRVPESAELAPALVQLAAAAHLAGDARALAVETRAAALAGSDALASLVRVRMLVAEGHMAAKRRDECLALFRAALALAEGLPASSIADRTIGVVANNVTSALLEHEGRSEDEDRFLLEGALAARRFWLRAGNWMNDERSDYLLALVHNAQGRHDQALEVTARALATIGGNGEEPVDAAFLHVARAVAWKELGKGAEQAGAIAEAERLRATFPGDDLRAGLDRELVKAR